MTDAHAMTDEAVAEITYVLRENRRSRNCPNNLEGCPLARGDAHQRVLERRNP